MMRPAGENSPPIIKLDTLIECKDSLDWSNVSFSVNMIFLYVRDLKMLNTQMCLFISSTLYSLPVSNAGSIYTQKLMLSIRWI